MEELEKFDKQLIMDSLSSDNGSVMTSLSKQCDSDFCLELYVDRDSDDEIDSVPFQLPERVEQRVERTVEEIKASIYEVECQRYRIGPINLVKEAILGNTGDVDFKNYGVRSLHLQVIFKIWETSPVSRITTLDLTNNEFSKFACYTLNDFIEQSTHLKSLVLKGCKIGKEGIQIISDGIMVSTSIETLDLSTCNLRDEGGKIVAVAVTRNYGIKNLNLSNNQLEIESSLALAEAVVENKSLKNLNLSYNRLCDDNGISTFLNGVAKSPSLEKLDLSWNYLSGKLFAKSLFRSCRRCKTLEEFNLSYNRLSTLEAKKLSLGLKKSESIKKIYLEQNLLSEDDLIILLNVFLTESKLIYMDLGKELYVPVDVDLLIKSIVLEKPHVAIIYRGRLLPNPPEPVYMKDICADRAKFLGMAAKRKKAKRDMGHFMLKLKSYEQTHIMRQQFLEMLEGFKAKKLDSELVDQYIKLFNKLVEIKGKTIEFVDIHSMADHYLARHPTSPPVKKAKKKKKAKLSQNQRSSVKKKTKLKK